MSMTPARSPRSAEALSLVRSLQDRFRLELEAASRGRSSQALPFEPVEWLRDQGRHGGGIRYEIGETPVFNRGSINVSQVHYDDEPLRKLSSATALSTIIHPQDPGAPSVHIHISWTEMRSGKGYWRLMADLNPALPERSDAESFDTAMRRVAGDLYEHAREQGEQYFFIPALHRHRGISHFYLEGHTTGDFARDITFAQEIGEAAEDIYIAILTRALGQASSVTPGQREAQRAYHTLYFFQVLTLDRGTTSGLLIHDQNDLGILGSLPARIDRALLASWREWVRSPQDQLVDALLAALPEDGEVTLDSKRRLAHAVRVHYRDHPEALELQASADIVPPTIDNHR